MEERERQDTLQIKFGVLYKFIITFHSKRNKNKLRFRKFEISKTRIFQILGEIYSTQAKAKIRKILKYLLNLWKSMVVD